MHLKYYLIIILFLHCGASYSQTTTPDLTDSTQWQVVNRKATVFNEGGKKGIRFNEVEGSGMMMLSGSNFSNGIIEVDIKGSSKMQQSFVGVAFHGKDEKTYDAIYFRPFNFMSDDTLRRKHAVQYISMPDNDWEKLRNTFPGKYEKQIETPPNPNDWFHAKIIVNGKHISVFVNNQTKPSIEVDKLNDNTSGSIGLWVGNNAAGDFANLKFTKTN